MKADYIGWAGHGNLGDDACLEAIRRLCAPLEIEQTTDPAAGLCILGGGTLLYGTAFLEPATKALRRGAKIAVLGSGVDLAVPLEEWEPWRRKAWGGLLRGAVAVGVRGPHSLEAVRRLGAEEARVIGDPALALGAARSPASDDHQRDLVLVNAGSDFVPDCGRERVNDLLAETIDRLHAVGLRVEYLPLRPNDLIHGKPLIERFGLPVVSCETAGVLRRIRRAHLVVSLRLHGAVFAASYGVPFVSLGYHPKCQDFAESVRGTCVPTNTLDRSALRHAIERLNAEYDAVAKRLNTRCNEYRRRQREMAAIVRSQGSGVRSQHVSLTPNS